MKYLNYIRKIASRTLLVCLLFNLSCSLERNPLSSFSEETFWTSEENAMLALTGLYKGAITYNSIEYSQSDWWGYSTIILLDGVSDIGYDRRGFNNDIGKLTSGALIASNKVLDGLWKGAYRRIESANRFLANVDNVPNISVAKLNRLKSEARFIRAAQYFYLASYYYDVPLVKTLLTLDEANNVKKSSRETILAFVIAELVDLNEHLPLQKEMLSSEIGRVNRQAAWAFIGRTHMLTKDYSKAAIVLKKIIDTKHSSIAPSYPTLFTEVNEHHEENIFSVQFVENITGYALPQHTYPAMYGGWSILNPSGHLFEAYEFTNGDKFSYTDSKYDMNDISKNRDPRLDYTIYYHGQTFKGNEYICAPKSGSEDQIASGQVTQTGFMPRKYLDENFAGSLNSQGGNLPIVRYADVLLMYLEAELESGTPITLEMLNLTINAVRGRADVNLPSITDTNAATLRDKIRDERMVELAFEGHRLWDLYRWGIAEEKLNAPIYGAPYGFIADKNAIRKKNGVKDPYYRWYVNTRSFKAEHQRWPVPTSEQNINPNLRD